MSGNESDWRRYTERLGIVSFVSKMNCVSTKSDEAYLSSCTRESPCAMVVLHAARLASLCCAACSSKRSAASKVSAAASSSLESAPWRNVSSQEANCKTIAHNETNIQ
ncbi:hypothetical protein B566_EDAN016114 [Ephemera danica]|nr:hypothetical protein B566_EDAN016114 [Ephemera danica]